MPAYWVARSRVIDPVEYKKYTDPLPAIFAKYGGEVLARGGRFQIMEGPEKFHRFVGKGDTKCACRSHKMSATHCCAIWNAGLRTSIPNTCLFEASPLTDRLPPGIGFRP